MGKNGRPTLELTRTQKRKRPVLPEKRKNPKVLPQTEQTTCQPQKLVKAESPGEPSIHLASSSVNQLEPSQAQGEQEDRTEEYGEEQMEYDGELDEETEAFDTELESLLQGDLGINIVFILPEKFREAKGQENTLEGDVFSKESFECRLAEVEEVPEQRTPTTKTDGTALKPVAEQLCFSKPT
ncbi:unnamed protein product [Prunus armeniaca]